MPANVPGGFLRTAKDINVSTSLNVFTDTIDALQPNDYYRFSLQGRSSFNLALNGLQADLDVQVIRDANGNGQVDAGEAIAQSYLGGSKPESISTTLDPNTYYIRVYAYGDAVSPYNLSVSATPLTLNSSANPIPTSPSNTNGTTSSLALEQSAPTSRTWINGTLGANQFTYTGTSQTTFFSGNGNVDFGSGQRDTLDLRTAAIASTQVSFNWATATTGGVVDNPGNGNRVFDAITLANGNRILFEGIEQIQFSDTTYDLSNYNITDPSTGAITKATVVPNDPLFAQQWDLHMTGVQNAWRFTTGTAGVLIGIQDSGLGTNSSGSINPDLRPTIFSGNNYLDESTSYSHGTQVQSTIAATINNGVGIAGINGGSDVYHIDVLGGESGDLDLATATQALINQANSKGQRLVVNLSLAGGYSDAFGQLIANNQDKALFVIAAGNDNTSTISSPGSLAQTYSNVVSVGSSWGRTDYYGNPKTPGERIDYPGWWGTNFTTDANVSANIRPLTLMAPSEFIAETANRNASGSYDFAYRDKFNGTSASTPIVSGIASLVWSLNPILTAGQVKAILSETAYDLGTAGYDKFYGNGFINADAAVRRALALARNYS
jgi:serine protease